MLETLKPLIGKLCSGTSVTPESFENGYAFSSYNTDFFAVWTIEDRFCFSWSERHPSAAFCIDTQSTTIASYIVIAAVGALRRADLFQDAISPAILTDELRSRWVSSPTRWPRVVNYQHIENPELSLNSTNCAALRQLQFAVQFSVEDYLNSYLNADAGPALTPFRTSFEPYLRQLSDAGVDISRMIPPTSSR